MRNLHRSRDFGAIFVGVMLVLAGCTNATSTGAGSGSTNDSLSSISADSVLEDFVAALAPLKSLGGSDGNPATEFRQVSKALGPLAGSLTDGIEGVPEDVSMEAAVSTGSLAVSIDLVVDCLSTTPTSCDSFVSNAVDRARDTGQAMSALVPYSSWTVEELASRL